MSTANKPKDEVPKIQAQAEALHKQIKAGGDFAELAKKNSQDPGSAQKGGDLGWVSRGQMVKNFEDAVFALKPNEISNVVTTEYGFHIIQVLEKQPAHLQTLDEVKPAIIATLEESERFRPHARTGRQSPRRAGESAAERAADRDPIEPGVREMCLRIAPAGPVVQLGNDPQVGAAIHGMKPSEVSDVLQSGTSWRSRW